MSRLTTSFILGYHGCSREVGEKALQGDLSLIRSDKAYDWLGPGIYFWENDPQRAMEWAEWKVARGDYAEAFVVGAVIDLGNCLNLLERENLEFLRFGYENLRDRQEAAQAEMPENRDAKDDANKDKILRFLDCAVIKTLHQVIEEQPPETPAEDRIEPFDSVRGLFTEGKPIYPGGSFFERTHTQIAVLNAACIKGVFRL